MNRLKELREERSLSIRELAERAGVHYNTIHRAEKHARTLQPRNRRNVAAALGVDPKELREAKPSN